VSLTIWAVSDGRAGIERQALSLGHALAELRPDVTVRPVRLTPAGPQLHLPPKAWIAPKAALPPQQRALFEEPLPDIWIGCGRRSLPYSMAMRKWSGGATFVVQVQDPRADLAAFDLVIPPEHDEVRGDNVFSILGAPVHFPAEALAAARAKFSALGEEARPRAAVVIGGPSKSHKLSPARETEIETKLAMLTKRHARLWITASRRTPESMVARLRAFAEEHGQRFWAPGDEAPNPYLGFLQYADVVLVTEDSTNMIGDAAFLGKPVLVLPMDGGSDKFRRLHAGFEAAGAARPYRDQIELWTYPPVREAERAAREILSRYGQRQAAGSL
jgi:mitochondrial fission protein ELM1